MNDVSLTAILLVAYRFELGQGTEENKYLGVELTNSFYSHTFFIVSL